MKTVLSLLAAASLCFAQGGVKFGYTPPNTFSVSVAASPTQAILSYAPPSSPCTIQVSPSASYAPLIADVNASLFTNANLDSRAGDLSGGGTTYAVIGRRAADVSTDTRRYGRPLTPNTTYYVKVSCLSGRSVATTSFTTPKLPSGSTYPETLAVDRSTPGTLAWPTTDNMTTSVVDPLTGIVIQPIAFNADDWPAGAGNLLCGDQTVTAGDGKVGYVCIVPNGRTVMFIDPVHQVSRVIGTMGTMFGTYAGDSLDYIPNAQNNYYSATRNVFLNLACTSPDGCNSMGPFVPVMVSGAYTGSFLANDLGITWTNLTPNATNNNILQRLAAYDARFSSLMTNWNNVGLTPDGNKIMFTTLESPVTQGTIEWIALADYTGAIVAALPSWLTSVTRWCGIHSQGIIDGSPDKVFLTVWNGRYTGGFGADFGGNGDGPWESKVTAGTLPLTPQYAVGVSVPTFGTCPASYNGLALQGCGVVTVAGQPCDPTIGPGETNNCAQAGFSGFHLADYALGDRVQAVTSPGMCGNNVCENMILIGISGSTLELGRGAPDGTCIACNGLLQDHPGLASLAFVCSCDFVAGAGGVVWDYVNDPHGTGSGVSVVSNDLSHGTATATGAFGQPDFFNCPAGVVDCTGTKLGTDANWTATMPTNLAPGFPLFNGISTTPTNQTGCGGTFSCVEHYSSGAPGNPTVANPSFYLDARPLETLATTWNSTATTNIYRVSVSGVGAPNLKSGNMAASCGGIPMVDVSSTATSISGPVAGLASAGTVCYANATGECYPGSTAGGIYANCSIGIGNNSVSFLTTNFAQAGKLNRIRFDSSSQTGKTIQPLTNCGRRIQQEAGFWSGRLLPSGDAGVCYADNVGGSGNSAIMAMYLPPLAVDDGVDRTTFIPIPITVPARAATTATIQFGYAENGSAAGFFCQSRQEACVTNQVSGIGGTPFYWAHEAPSGVACGGGCTITIPGISGRVVYYQAIYSDGHHGPEAVAVVP